MYNNNHSKLSQHYKSRAGGALTKSVDRRTWKNYVSAIFLSLLLVIISIAISVVLPLFSVQADSGAPVSVWWPTESVPVSGQQPFKAMISGISVEQYDMYWQVDNGQLNSMSNSYQDYQHKEAVVDVSGWNWKGSGPYTINFVAKQGGNIIAQHSMQLRLNNSQPAPQVSAPQVVLQPAPQPAPTTQAVSPIILALAPQAKAATIEPTQTSNLYVNPASPAAAQASSWRSSRPADAAMMDTLAAQPQAVWLGNWNANVQSDAQKVASAAAEKNTTAVFVAYNIPGRDCGGYSAGGTNTDAYAAWVRSVAAGIGSSHAMVILEPDAIAGISCLSAADQQTRLNLISNAVDILKSNTNTKVYIDGGHSGWVDATTMANNMKKVIAKADGFFLNVSNFKTTADETAYGTQISNQLGGKHFVIDTSRNGLGPLGQEWCNPAGRAIGQKPTTSTGNPLIDAYLWVKTPGESDGSCNGASAAGQWWADYALGLVQRAE
jgi:endoglucanase